MSKNPFLNPDPEMRHWLTVGADPGPAANEFERLTAEALPIFNKKTISESTLQEFSLQNADWRVFSDEVCRGMTYEMRAYIYGLEGKTEEVDARYETVPTTWWDMLKDTFATWLQGKQDRSHSMSRIERFRCALAERVRNSVRRRQIRQTTVVKHWHVCPHVQAAPQSRHLEFLARR